MKKTKFLALTLIVAIMLMGAGYAWWTDNTVVDSEISTGEMDVNIVTLNELTTPIHTSVELVEDGENNIVFKAKDLYPTTPENRGQVKFRVRNDGTLPVKLGSLNYSLTDETSDAWNHMKAIVFLQHGYWNQNGAGFPLVKNLIGENPARILLKDLGDTILQYAKDYEIPQEHGLQIVIEYYLDEEAGNDTTELEDIGFNLKLNWEQFNR